MFYNYKMIFQLIPTKDYWYRE